ncbi:MAG: hypothetical protein AB7I37_00940 [Pirellulales bacterium]
MLTCTLALALLGLGLDLARADDTPAAEQPAAVAAEPSDFMRLVRDDEEEPISLDTAVVRYQHQAAEDGVVVDLIGVIHIADEAYYSQMNELFEQYDVLLFEMVSPKSDKVSGGSKAALRALHNQQTQMQKQLGLAYQLDEVDYSAKNFVHADMSAEEMLESMEKNGELGISLIARLIAQNIVLQTRMQGKGSDLDLLFAYLADDPHLAMKRVMSEMLIEGGVALDAFEAAEGSTLITHRNKVALGVLDEQLKAGKKKIGIFYGAGHMADMERRLKDEFGLHPVEQTWMVAWDMRTEVEGEEVVAEGEEE